MTRVRFAPSPTGYIHVGNARTALFNWMFARKTGGTFILRIEDTDRERSSPAYERALMEDLRWLGIDWDEGPDVGGPYSPYRQSERIHIYDSFIQKLLDAGRAYHCYCTNEALQARREAALAEGEVFRYDNRCRDLTAEERTAFEARGIKPAVRFRVPAQEIVIEDLVRGTCRFDSRLLGDFVLRKTDGMPTYHFGVVVDDGLMEVTHVIRGEGHLPNTPLHVLLFETLGFRAPTFAHMSHTIGDKGKLAKRKGDFSIRAYREVGYLPEALANYLSLLGWHPKRREETFRIEEVIDDFDPSDLSHASARYDQKKWEHVAAAHLQRKTARELAALVRPFAEAAGLGDVDEATLEKVVDASKTRARTLAEVAEQAHALLARTAPADEDRSWLSQPAPQAALAALRNEIAPCDDLSADRFVACVKAVGRQLGIKGKDLYHPIRLALTGTHSGPDMVSVAAILGKEEVTRRLNDCIIQDFGISD